VAWGAGACRWGRGRGGGPPRPRAPPPRGGAGGATYMPAIKVREFTFSSLSDAV